MDYARKIIRSLLFEEVAQNLVSYAIRKRHEVSFKYNSNDGDPHGKAERITVQPVAYGLTKTGNPCFRAYQLNGSSESAEKGEGTIPGWRLFLLDRVVTNSWKDSGRTFKEPPMYNPNGDNTMSTVLVKADFTGSERRYEKGGLKKYNTTRHEKNVEKNPFYDFEKQVNKKEMAPDYVMRNIAATQKSPVMRQREWDNATAAINGSNQQSIADMSRQQDFGDDEQTETVGPFTKGNSSNKQVEPQKTLPNYSKAKQNGPVFKGTQDNDQENLDNDEYKQRDSESTETDVR